MEDDREEPQTGSSTGIDAQATAQFLSQAWTAYVSSGLRYWSCAAGAWARTIPLVARAVADATGGGTGDPAERAANLDELRAQLRELVECPANEGRTFLAELDRIAADAGWPGLDRTQALGSDGPIGRAEASLSGSPSNSASRVIAELGFAEDIERLRREIAKWISGASYEVESGLRWRCQAGSKLLPAPHRVQLLSGDLPGSGAAAGDPIGHRGRDAPRRVADHRRHRRQVTIQARSAHPPQQVRDVPALMVSGYIVADAYRLVRRDPHDIGLLSELLKRLGVAECLQWRIRRQPNGVEDWRRNAVGGHWLDVRGLRLPRHAHRGAAALQAPPRRSVMPATTSATSAERRRVVKVARKTARRYLDASRRPRHPRPGHRRALHEARAESRGSARHGECLRGPASGGRAGAGRHRGGGAEGGAPAAHQSRPLIGLVQHTRRLSNR